jgi:hypothetical protein
MRISPLPRRYFRLRFVLSFRSSFQHGGVHSSTTAQCTFSRNSSISWSYRVMYTPRVERRSWVVRPWACLRPCPAPKPRDGRAARARGTRGSLRRTLVARPALAVAISALSLLTRSWTKPARTENTAQKQGRSTGQITPTLGTRFPLSKNRARLRRCRERRGSDHNFPVALGAHRS